MSNEQLITEQAYLNQTLGKINESLDITKEEIKKSKGSLADAASGWDDVRVKTSTYSGIVETAMSVRQQQQAIAERESAKSRAEVRFQTLSKQAGKPYFARIDFTDPQDDGQGPESIYIGLASYSDEEGKFWVYDWRTPVASIYYDGGLGQVDYLTPVGPQRADVSLKRQFEIEGGDIVTLFDTEEAIGDAMLLNALSGESSTKMKSIVTTIQKEQNKIIRNTDADLLFVQGAAGSGKTAAIMQRVAYLLYRYRGKLNSGQVVMFSPNQLFNDYVDQVLPELGEQNLVQLTFFQYASRRLPRFAVQTLAERFEQTVSNEKIDRMLGSLEMFKATQKYAQSLNQKGLHARNLNFRGEPLITREKILDIYYQYNENYKLSQRLEATQDTLLRSLRAQVGVQMKKDWVELAIENLSKEEYDEMVGAGSTRIGDDEEGDAGAATRRHQLGAQPQEREFKSDKQERNFLAKKIVTQALRPLAKKIRRSGFININAQYVDFLKVLPNFMNLADFGVSDAEWTEYLQQVIADFKDHKLTLANTTIYLYLYDLITGKHGQRDIRYLFIDEIQDYTPYQLAFLKFSFPNAKFTVLGDLNQAIFTQDWANSLEEDFASLFAPEKVEMIELTQTYRSTEQITNFSKELLENGKTIEAFNRDGELPVLKLAKDEAGALQAVKDQLQENAIDQEQTAIITQTLEAAQDLAANLDGEDVTLIHSENQRLAPGAVIIPSYLAKGLEFDAVVIWQADADHYSAQDQQRLLYTVASRAMHRLTMIGAGEISPLIQAVHQSLYAREEV
ncbi:RNA polymerase recycling motor HelD [Fructobacillus ficulneus]|uniref:Superfamily I DNA/RNA helicase n=1 Tax=Fructobacillus ficulneus TaxID=157463 RepID=A0A0K8MG26_9LACO|nr:RNA polymerase recycling motor HelD [Fructobacillus ficulneus]GAO99158.1 superfamily I DNA/RNA helicase [Fructobacillus ficulneus]